MHRRIAAEQGDVVCLAGLPRVKLRDRRRRLRCDLMLGARRTVRARADDRQSLVAALFLLGFAAWSTWYVGGWLKRNKPHRYEPESVPEQLLP